MTNVGLWVVVQADVRKQLTPTKPPVKEMVDPKDSSTLSSRLGEKSCIKIRSQQTMNALSRSHVRQGIRKERKGKMFHSLDNKKNNQLTRLLCLTKRNRVLCRC